MGMVPPPRGCPEEEDDGQFRLVKCMCCCTLHEGERSLHSSIPASLEAMSISAASSSALRWHSETCAVACVWRWAPSTGVGDLQESGPPQVPSAPGTAQDRYQSSPIVSKSPLSMPTPWIPSSRAASAAVCTHRSSGEETTRVIGGSPSSSI